MSLREEQCNKVCRILDNVLANRPTERDSLIVAVRKAFKALAEPSQVAKDIARIVDNGQDMRVIAQPKRIKGRWIPVGGALYQCDQCGAVSLERKFCSDCGADMREVTT